MFCMPVNILGVGIPSSVKREPSVPPLVGVEDDVIFSCWQASRAMSTGRVSSSSQYRMLRYWGVILQVIFDRGSVAWTAAQTCWTSSP